MGPMVITPDIDDAKPTHFYSVQAGRPRLTLTTEQQEQIVQLYREAHLSQARIAQEVGIAIPRVRRHLVEAGLYRPRAAVRTPAREQQLSVAVLAYEDGEKVVEICQTHHVNPAELYRELRARHIPYRTRPI